MPAALALDDRSLADLEEFGSALTAVGLQAWRSTVGAARTFQGRVERAGGWDHVELDTQLEWIKEHVRSSHGCWSPGDSPPAPTSWRWPTCASDSPPANTFPTSIPGSPAPRDGSAPAAKTPL